MNSSNSVPPFEYFRDPVDLQIRIYPNGSRYGADLLAFGKASCVVINISPNDLAKINRELQRAMGDVALQYCHNSADMRQLYLAELARLGHWAYGTVFR